MYKNIFYFRLIKKIGGTEQFLYEIAKKYKDYDITIFYDEADNEQLARLRPLVRCKKRTGQKIQCEKAFYNFNLNMIEDVEAKEHIFVAHANYEELGYKPPIDHPKLTKVIGVSQFSTDKIKEYIEKLGLELEAEKCYNPLTLEPKQKVPILVSACRLDDRVKGGERTLRLIEALDRYCKEHNRNYLWLIFTNPPRFSIGSNNVVILPGRTDVRAYESMADYVLQLSNDMETYCYTINEALGYGVPIVTTPLSILKELPITDNEHITLEWNCENVDDVARQIFEKKVEPFEYKIPKDNWNNVLAKGKSTYQKELKQKVKVEALINYTDLEKNKKMMKGDIFECSKPRAEYLMEINYVKEVI